MFFGNIANLDRTAYQYPPAIARALRYLREHQERFRTMEPGVYPVEGTDVFAQVINLGTKPKEETRPEVHRKYIDVQFSVEGRERIGFAADRGTSAVAEDLMAEKDILFYRGVEHEMELLMEPGDYAVFFPEDVHRPGCEHRGPATLRKVIMKVSADLVRRESGGGWER